MIIIFSVGLFSDLPDLTDLVVEWLLWEAICLAEEHSTSVTVFGVFNDRCYCYGAFSWEEFVIYFVAGLGGVADDKEKKNLG